MININIDGESFNDAVMEVVDSLTAHGLKQAREGLINDYRNAKDGNMYNIFVVGDTEADALEIRRRIEAFDLILDYFTVDHEPYDFEEDE